MDHILRRSVQSGLNANTCMRLRDGDFAGKIAGICVKCHAKSMHIGGAERWLLLFSSQAAPDGLEIS